MSKKSQYIELFKKFGFILNDSEESFNILNVDQRIFQSNLRSFIQKSDDNPNWEKNLTNLKSFLESYLENENNFYISLLPTKNNNDQVVSHSSNQDNLLKLLLEIKELQADLFEYLITKVLNYSDENEANADVQILNLDINVPTYIISQFRYQPKINEPEKLCQKLMELIESLSSIPLQREIISCFPDILCDCQHDDLISELEKLLDIPDLISVTLDTLSNLKFKNENLFKVAEKLFSRYSVLNENDLPAVVKFFLKSASSLNSKEIMNNLRDKVKLDEISNQNTCYLILDIIREYFYISNQLIDLYMSIMNQALIENNNNKKNLVVPLDFVILPMIYSMPQHFKPIDKIVKQILREETFRNLDKSIQIVFKHAKSFINELFDPMCLMAKTLIQNSLSFISSVGQLIFKIGFELLDKKLKLELINVLIELITSTNGPSRDNSLDVLVELSSKSSTNPLCGFSMQLKALLDYIEYFSLSQIRKVYLILCGVAYSISKPLNQPSMSVSAISSSYTNRAMDTSYLTTNCIQDNLHILINKQLSSNCLKYKQIGVIGALMMIKNMAQRVHKPSHDDTTDLNSSDEFESCSSSPVGTQNLPTNSTTIQNGSILTSNVSNEIKNIWQMILDSSKSSPESLGLFEDDLTSIILKDSINKNLEDLIKSNLEKMTKELFDPTQKSSLTKYQTQLSTFKIGYEFGIDTHVKGALNLLPAIMNDMQKKNSFLLENPKTAIQSKSIGLPSIAIPSTFRLMCALERKNIDDFKAYLGAPILCINKDELYKYGNFGIDSGLISTGSNLYQKFKNSLSEDEKKIICNSIFLVINWFIELINGFCSKLNESDDYKLKLVDRLTRVIELQQILTNLLPHMKFYRPPMVVFGLVDSSVDELPYVHQLIKVKEAKSKGKGGVKRKGQKEDKKKALKKTKKEKDLFDGSDIEDEKEIVGDTDEENESTVLEENKENFDLNTTEVDLSKISIYFREFDLSLINFVNLDLELNPNIIPDSSSFQNRDLKLKPNNLFYVLTDFNRKLTLILKIPSTNSKLPALPAKPTKVQQFLQVNPIEPSKLIQNLIDSHLESLFDHLDSINKHIRDIQKKNDNIKDPGEICNQKHNQTLLKCLSQILKLASQLFAWLHSNNEQKLIDKAFRLLLNKVPMSSSLASTQADKVPEIACFNYLARLREVILDLSTGNTLIQFLDLLANKIMIKKELFNAHLPKFRKILCLSCSEFLLNDYNVKLNSMFCTRQLSNEAITFMLNCMFKNNEDSLALVETLVKIITSQEFMEDRQNCGKFNTLKHHFLSYYKVLLEYTVSELKFTDSLKFTDIETNKDLIVEVFSKIRTIVQMHSGLVNMKKNLNFKEINILTVIKNSRLFINNFLKYSMPWLDQAFESMKQEVVYVLQEIQKPIHFIQEQCLTKDQSAIAKQAPIYMRGVEGLMLRIRQMLYVNSCSDAFTVSLFEEKLKIDGKSSKKRASSAKAEKKSSKKDSKKKVKKETEPEPESEIETENDENEGEEQEQSSESDE